MVYLVSCRLVGSRLNGLVLVEAPNRDLAKKLAQEAVYSDSEISQVIFGADDVVVDSVKPLTGLEREEFGDIVGVTESSPTELVGWGT